jgi:hypothetical protein
VSATSRQPASTVADPADRWVRLALVLAAVAPFVASIFYGYVYDDTAIILRKPAIHGWGGLVRVWTQPYWTDSIENGGLYRPLLMAIFALIWNGAHKYAIAFHLFVVAAHTVATLLLWTLLRRAVGTWPAALGALWFALHPVHVEAVANITNSSEVLVTVCALAFALLAQDPPRGWRLVGCAALYASALLIKESGATIPILALAAGIGWRAGGDPRRVDRAGLREWAPVIGACLLVGIAIALIRDAVLGGFVSNIAIAAPGLAERTAVDRVWAMLSLGGRVARLLFWPTTLNPHYGPTVLPPTPGPTLAATMTVVVLVGLLGVLSFGAMMPTANGRRDARPLVGFIWICVAFLPASNLLVATGQILAERTLYLSSAGAAMLVAWAIDRARESVRVRSVALAAAIGIAAGASGRGFVKTREYTAVWKDQSTLFPYMITVDSAGYRGYQLLAMEMDRVGRTSGALRLYARAYALAPRDRIVAADYAAFLLEHHDAGRALAVAQRLIDDHPDLATNRRAVSLLLNATGAAYGADSVLASAMRLDGRAPSPTAALFIGLAHEARGDRSSARAIYSEALRRTPNDSSLAARLASLDR